MGRGTRISFVLVALLVCIVPAAASGDGTNLLANGSFEGSLSGWSHYQAALSQASDGVDGAGAALVTFTSGTGTYSLYTSPSAVTGATAGDVYQATAWVRSDVPGRTTCLKVRELNGSTEVTTGASPVCITATSAWQQFPTLSYTVQQSGDILDVIVFARSPVTGDSFEADGVSLVKPSAVTDTTPPDTTITSGPTGSTTATDASFSFSATEPSAFQCELDGAAWSTCTSPQAYSGLAVGSHTFAVRATDTAGNVDPTPASQTWSITAPSANLLPNGSFEGSLSGWSHYQSTLSLASGGVDGTSSALVTYTSGTTSYSIFAAPQPVAGATAGDLYSADAWVRSDFAGRTLCLNVREWSGGATITTGQAPVCMTSATGWQQFPQMIFKTVNTGDALDVVVYERSPVAGDTFQVDSVDFEHAQPVTDTTPPETTITSGPTGSTTATAASFAFGSSEPATFQCALDGAAWSTCTSPASYSSLTIGSHTFQVRAVDAAGNIDPSPASQSWTVVALANVIANPGFEGSASGWKTSQSQIQIVSGGTDGKYSARVSNSHSTSGYGIYPSSKPVTSTNAGEQWTGYASLRSNAPGQTVCMDIREWRGTTAVGSAESCLTMTSGWQQLPSVTYVPAASGDSLDILVFQKSAAGKRDSFDVDSVMLYRSQTAPPAGDPSILAAGDIASCASNGDEATAAVVSQYPTLPVLTTGDNVYEGGTATEFANCFNPTWGAFKSRIHPTPGAHEYFTTGATPYYNYFGAAAGTAGKGYYSFDLGTWHVIALNSNCASVGGCNAGSPEEQWLRADLAAHPNQCTLAYWADPRFSSGSEHGSDPAMQDFWQALYDSKADVVLSGHDHDYERFAPQTPTGVRDDSNGIREFVVGTGGRSHYAFATPVTNSEVRDSTSYGVLQLTLHPGSYDWRFRPVSGATFTDSGSTACH